MKGKLLRLTIVSLCVSTSVFAQQDKLLTHFIFDKMSLNPGATASNLNGDGFCLTSVYRNQWDKVNGAPNSALFNGAARLERFFPGRIGVSFWHDAIGFSRQNNVVLNYAYPLEIPGAGVLGIGVGIGIHNFSMDPTWAPPTTLIDPTLPTGYGSIKLDANFGLYFKGDQGWYAGLSSTHLPGSFFDATDSQVPGQPAGTAGDYNMVRHFYVMGGYRYKDIHDGGDIEGNLLARTDLLKYSMDINARYIWRDMAYGGLTYRTSDAVAVMVGASPLKLMNGGAAPDLTIGYAYDVTVNKLSSISKGSHEILLKYCYNLPPIPISKSKHPRWL